MAGEVIEEPGQPPRVAAEGVLLADPPSGGIVELRDLSWDGIAFTDHSGGVRSSDEPLMIYGNWDGDTLSVTSVSEPADDGWSTKFSIERNPACSTDEALAPFYELDHDSVGILYWSEVTDANGQCTLNVRAIADSPALTQAIASIAARATIIPIVQRV